MNSYILLPREIGLLDARRVSDMRVDGRCGREHWTD